VASTSAWAQALSPIGTTYPYTQQLQWIDSSHFIVGRLDGSMTIFRPPGAFEFGPTLTNVLRTPANRGVEMLAVQDNDTFVTSNDATTIALWQRGDETTPTDPGYHRLPPVARFKTFSYDSDPGIANSGVFLTYNSINYLVTGHENGYVLVWRVSANGRNLTQLRKIDVRSPNPIPSPFQLWNVRDIVVWKDNLVVTGSEDGDLVLLRITDGQVLVRERYNPAAQRGINGLAILGDYLTAVVCSVGSSDQNTWLFRVENSDFVSLDSIDVKQNLALPQSFAFRAAMATVDGSPNIFVSSQEGILWTVEVTPTDELQIVASTTTDFALGDAMDFEPSTRQLAVVGVLVNLFQVAAP
jgi:hypothetical protein